MSMSTAERAAAYRARSKDDPARPKPAGGWAKLTLRPPAEQKEYAKHRRATRKDKEPQRPFMAVDGEGAGLDTDGVEVHGEVLRRQQYRLLRVGDRELFTGQPLSTIECLEHILGAPQKVLLVGFAFGYDSTMILKDLPEKRRERLLNGDKIGPTADPTKAPPDRIGALRYTYWRNYAIDYLPRNYLRVARTMECHEKVLDADGNQARDPETGRPLFRSFRKTVKGTGRTIWDVWGCFQSTFVNALTAWDVGTPEQRDAIEQDKKRRDSFVTIGDRERQYCALECVLLEEMMSRFRQVCQDADIVPANWAGAGKLSSVLHLRHKTPTGQMVADKVPAEARLLASEAYYGGRFEVMRTGQLTGPVYAYDIKSAYPAAMAAHLPCIEHGEWEALTPSQCAKRFADYDPDQPFVARLKFTHDLLPDATHPNLYGLPMRTKTGRLEWPRQGGGVYWSGEVKAAVGLGCRPRWGSGWGYVRRCDCRPCAWVEELYKYRQSIGSDGRGKVIKLAINGLYGKLAQRIGNPRFSNLVWAGLITARTRAQIMEAAARDPESVVMIATDAVFSRRPLPVEIGDGLGQWEQSLHDGLHIVQPGLYWGPRPAGYDPDDEASRKRWKVKSRGIGPGWFGQRDRDTGLLRVELFERAWGAYADRLQAALCPTDQEGLTPPKVALKLRLFIGLRLAQHRGLPGLAGVWHDRPHEVSYEWGYKRATGNPMVWEEPMCVWHYPLPGNPRAVSEPHKGLPRDSDPLADPHELTRAELEDMPDWMDLGPVFV